ncbi:L-2,4-diaminobutyrate transaminase [Tepidamorphus gemmatus]|jgi:L-2,4-diaminobutyrate transaminase|uniref:L-2,4-diaminobutyrate transaminase n=1 Tax=Tepidamorphus gemmatus TaxID=747076 RepID=A0A4R3MAZ9_9HYPH|nr:aminotransferase [Tepidamorphus gemmatus]TCT09893.1 L-2,4-diaminobutyrate transaminase [Tepidamorphus gemmatus]
MTLHPTHNLSVEELDRQSVFHPFTALAQHNESGPRIMVSGSGVRLKDRAGREYIDALAGLWCVNIGYGRTEIAEAVDRQLRELPYYHSFASMGTEPAAHVADRLKRMLPGEMGRVFFGLSGSDANDTQVKLVWYYNNLLGRPRKKKIIARKRAYHGVTVAAASLTGLPVLHNAFDLPIDRILHTVTPHHYWNAEPGMSEEDFARHCAAELDALIEREGPDTVAAFIAEPVMGAGGVIVPPKGYFQEIQKVLKKHDVLMIADEVICGFGRLGRMFGCEVFGIEPDMVTVAKGITSGYVPLSASVVSEKMWQVLMEESRTLGVFGHGYTYTAHPVSCAAAMANLDILEGEKLADRAAETGAYMQTLLRETFEGQPAIGEVRGIGLIAAVELVADPAARTPFDPALKVAGRVAARALDNGLITRALPNGDSLAFSPPLVISRADVEACVERLAASIAGVRDELIRDGVRIA